MDEVCIIFSKLNNSVSGTSLEVCKYSALRLSRISCSLVYISTGFYAFYNFLCIFRDTRGVIVQLAIIKRHLGKRNVNCRRCTS